MENPSTELTSHNNGTTVALPPEAACLSNIIKSVVPVGGNYPQQGATTALAAQGSISANNMTVKNDSHNTSHTTIHVAINSASPSTTSERIQKNIQDPIQSNIPALVPSFKGREDVIKELHDKIGHNKPKTDFGVLSRAAVICGMPGVGKTQTVRYYIGKYKADYDNVIWINAEKHSAAISCFHALADHKRISVKLEGVNGKQKKEEFILEEIYDILCKQLTLLVFDNVESYNTDEEDDLNSLLPQDIKAGWTVPAIIVTTRNRKNWEKILLIHLYGLTESESFSLLSQLDIKDSEETRRQVKEITELCQGLPLVLQQVIAIVRDKMEDRECVHEEPYTLQDFLTELNEDRERKELLFTKLGEPGVANNVSTVFDMAFKQLENKPHGREALVCLDVMALLNPDHIPTKLLTSLLDPVISNVSWAFKLLHQRNLVSMSPLGFYQVHRIIQDMRLKSINPENEKESSTRISADELLKSFSQFLGEVKRNEKFLHEILENGARILQNRIMQSANGKTQNAFKERLATKMKEIGKYAPAEKLYREVLDVKNKDLEPEDPGTLTTKHKLASVMYWQGKYDEAEELNRAVLQAENKVLGPEHPDTLTTQHNLASVMYSQGKYDEAEELYRAVLQAENKVLGPEHPDTLATQHNLALVMKSQGKYDEAEELYRAVLQAENKVLGPEHPDTLATQHNLASVMYSQGKYDEAEELNRAVLQAQNKVLGPEHPDTLTTQHNLASVMYSQGKYDEAEELNRAVLEARNKVLGPEHPDTLTNQNNLASVVYSQGNYDEAEELYRDVLQARNKVLGPEHPYTLTTQHNLALVLKSQEKYDEE